MPSPLKITPLTDMIMVAGQVAADDVSGLAEVGVTTVVSHRPDGEEPGQPDSADLRRAFEAAGISFVLAPVSGFPTNEAVQRTADAIATADGKVLLFCRSGLRSTVTWALARRLAGDDADDLREAARAAGYDLSSVPL